MNVSFLGQKYNVYVMHLKNKTSYTFADKNGDVKKIIKHTAEDNGLRKREILSPEGDLLGLTIYDNMEGKNVVTTYDLDGRPKRVSITENKGKEKKSVITTFFDGGEKVSKMISIEENPILTDVSEILYDESGEIIKTSRGTYLKNH